MISITPLAIALAQGWIGPPWITAHHLGSFDRSADHQAVRGGRLGVTMSPGMLPSFRNPPVTEVVVGVTFRPIDGLSVPRLGQLWSERFATELPRIEEQPPYEPPIEHLGQPSPIPPIEFQFGGFPRPRVWFINNEGDEVVQLQHNYFACNWRKVHPDAEYGRWDSRRSAFRHWFTTFESFLLEHSLGRIEPTQCEVTYINHIESNASESPHSDAPRIFRLVGSPPFAAEGLTGTIEQVRLAQQLLLKYKGTAFGRLHLVIQPAFRRTDKRAIYVFELTARGRPSQLGLDGILNFFDQGREAVVQGFAASTTPYMHDHWQRYE